MPEDITDLAGGQGAARGVQKAALELRCSDNRLL
jgi:hypothetical protein